MVNEASIRAAIADLESQLKPNYAATATKYEIDRDTLRRRFKGETVSNAEAHARYQLLLSTTEEKVLVERINTLSARGMPVTPKIVENLVKELVKGPVGERWVSRFTARHSDKLSSIYLDSIDYARRVADNTRHYEHYFMLVGVYFLQIHIYNLIFRANEPDSSSLSRRFKSIR